MCKVWSRSWRQGCGHVWGQNSKVRDLQCGVIFRMDVPQFSVWLVGAVGGIVWDRKWGSTHTNVITLTLTLSLSLSNHVITRFGVSKVPLKTNTNISMHLVEKESEQYDIKQYFYIVFCIKNLTCLKRLATVLLIPGDSYHPLALRGVKQPYFLDKSAFSFYHPAKRYVLLVKPGMFLLTPPDPESAVVRKVVASPQPVFICDLLTAGKSIILISPSSEFIRTLRLIPEGRVVSFWRWTITLYAAE